MPCLENETLTVSLNPEQSLSVCLKADGTLLEQCASPCPVSDAALRENRLTFDVNCSGFVLHASLFLPESGGMELRLDSDGPMPEEVAWPPAWKMAAGDIGIFPLGTGFAFPIEELSFPLPETMSFYSGMSASMNLFGFQRGPLCVLTGVECGFDAVLRNTQQNGLFHSHVVWQGEKGEWGYSRAIRWFFADGLSEGAAQYRAWRESLGEVVTLKQKEKHTPELKKLIGAADLWLWDDNNMNRLYARPEEPEKTPRDVRKIAGELEALGMDRILWNSFEGETPEECAFLKSKGFLVGKYDIYRDVLPKPDVDQIIPYRVKRSVNTKYWPEIVRMERDGEYGRAWQLHGLDGKLHFQNAVCDIPALKLTMENVPPDVEKVGYNSRFIDVQAGSTLQECYHPRHPATRSDSIRYINNQLRFLADIGLVCGVEVGCEAAVGSFHFSEGMMSPLPFRAEDAGRRMTTIYSGEEVPPSFPRYMLNPQYRIPLWQLVYHDCVVSYWYWGDSSNCCPELMPVRDLFDALYGEPPLYSLTATQWAERKEEIAASYHRVAPAVRATGLARMLSFELLTPDRLVQRTTFENGVVVTANFSGENRVLEGGTVLPPCQYLLTQKKRIET